MYGVCQIPTFFATVFGARGRASGRAHTRPLSLHAPLARSRASRDAPARRRAARTRHTSCRCAAGRTRLPLDSRTLTASTHKSTEHAVSSTFVRACVRARARGSLARVSVSCVPAGKRRAVTCGAMAAAALPRRSPREVTSSGHWRKRAAAGRGATLEGRLEEVELLADVEDVHGGRQLLWRLHGVAAGVVAARVVAAGKREGGGEGASPPPPAASRLHLACKSRPPISGSKRVTQTLRASTHTPDAGAPTGARTCRGHAVGRRARPSPRAEARRSGRSAAARRRCRAPAASRPAPL